MTLAFGSAVRQPALQGHQEISGLWFPNHWFDPSTKAQRLFKSWQPGCVAWRFPQGDLLKFAAPMAVDCQRLLGWPLIEQHQCLSTAFLSTDEALLLPTVDVRVIEGAQVLGLRFDQAEHLDPSSWLSMQDLAFHDTVDCRPAAATPEPLVMPVIRDVRDVLRGKVPPASAEQQAFLKSMLQRQDATGQASTATAGRKPALPASERRFGFLPWLLAVPLFVVVMTVAMTVLMAALRTIGPSSDTPSAPFDWGRILAWLATVAVVIFLLRLRKAPAQWTAAEATQVSDIKKAPSPPDSISARKSWLKPQAWRQWLARLAVTSQVSKLLGRRQGAYVRRMLDMFENGQLDEALRHAIPLGRAEETLGQSFGSPSARSNLNLQPGQRASVAIHLGEDLDSYLRKLYRKSFETLDRQGRIDEAVFVLAELLQARGEALDYLEKHKRFAQAAELALAWDQPADVIVRLHCLANDWRRALAVARRDQAFANAVLQLEKKWPQAADQLRLEWAQTLAAQGDWLLAIEVIWPLKSQHGLATQWLACAEASGGELGAKALVQRAILLPQTLDAWASRLADLRHDPKLHLERTAMVDALLATKSTAPALNVLARAVTPAILADRAQGRAVQSGTDLKRLIAMTADPYFQADMPKGAMPALTLTPLSQRQATLPCALPDRAGLAMTDAVPLSDDRYLLALGEAGLLVVDAHGRHLARYEAPAYELVLGATGRVVLALAPRQDRWRVTRIDLVQRTVLGLGQVEFDHCAKEFDGIAWTLLHGSLLRVLDTQKNLQEVLWQVSDLPGRGCALSAAGHLEQVLLQVANGALVLWRYARSPRRLLARDVVVEAPTQNVQVRTLHEAGGFLDLGIQRTSTEQEQLFYKLRGRTFPVDVKLPAGATRVVFGAAGSGWLVLGVHDQTDITWMMLVENETAVRAMSRWPLAAQPRVRIVGSKILIHDQQGRLLCLNTATATYKTFSLA